MLPFGLDAVVLLLLVVARMPWLAESLGWDAAPALTIACMLYLGVDVVSRWRGLAADDVRSYRLKLLLLYAVAIAYCLIPTVRLIVLRAGAQPWMYVHDNIIQTEAAVRFLLEGKNPYAVTYLDTALYRWDALNPALYHYVNLPFQILIAVPTNGHDLRITYTILFCWTAALLPGVARDRTSALMLVAIFVLNPLFTRSQVEGRNDIVVIWTVVMAVWLLQRGWLRMAAVFFGVACASKHTAWIAIPFVFYAGGVRLTWPAWATAAVLFLPFVVWAPRAFYDSVFGYPSGTVPHSYPIRGEGAYGFATWVLSWGWVKNDEAYYPFGRWQLGFGIPTMAAMLLWWRRERTLASAIFAYAMALFPFQFFGRYFNQNHIGYIIFLFALGTFVREIPKKA